MRRAEAMASADYPMLYVFHRSNTMLLRNNVLGYYFDYSGGIWLRTAYIAE
jgi:ABC-type oligopeptide transport system substrate-binding subunit